MELKISLKKAFSFLATIVPGSVLFYLFEIGHPGTIGWFLSISSLGYKSRIFLLLLALFLLGYSFVKFLAAVCGSFGWLLGRTIRLPIFDRHPYDYATAPWRDKRWRAAYTRRFAIDAPPDLAFTPDSLDEGKIVAISKLQPGEQTSPELSAYSWEVLQACIKGIFNDEAWRSRYLQLHVAEITKIGNDFASKIGASLDSNISISSLVIIVASWFVPQIRLWWLLLLAYLWAANSAMVFAEKIMRLFDPSSTLQAQFDVLTSAKQ